VASNFAGRNQSEGSDEGRRGGLYDGFEGYRTPTDRDYHKVLTQGLVIPDTNVFLSLYRYNQQARSDLLSVLGSFGDRLFVPHQVMIEFWRNRESVLRDPLQGQAIAKELDGYRIRTNDALRNWSSRAGFRGGQADELSRRLDSAFDAALRDLAGVVKEEGGGFANDTGSDPVLAELERVLAGRVGAPLDGTEYQDSLLEARRRVELKIPPGYMDASKRDGGPAGDYLIWREIIREATIRKCDVLVVTGDAKEDWWRRERGELRGPRPELVQEIKAVTGAELFMLRPDSLLLRARRVLEIRVHDETVEDVERVTDQSDSGGSAKFGEDLVRRSWGEILETLKVRSRVAALLLASASVDEVSGESVTLEFQRRADARAFVTRRLDRMLAEVMSEFFNTDIDVIVTI
jgi:hypothetical protein